MDRSRPLNKKNLFFCYILSKAEIPGHSTKYLKISKTLLYLPKTEISKKQFYLFIWKNISQSLFFHILE